MTLHNGKRIVFFRLLSLVATVLFVIYMLLAYFADELSRYLDSRTITIISAVVVVLYIMVILWPMIRQIKYIYFSDDGRSVIIRWYSIGLMSGESHSIEIPKETFSGYEITGKLGGFYRYITLYQTVQSHRAAYPPVVITSLHKEEIRKISEALARYK